MYCQICNAELIRKPKESLDSYQRRITCSDECARLKRNESKRNCKMCFCGNPQNRDNAPFCSWDCRLIAIKCDRWKIPRSMKLYNKKNEELIAEQRAIDEKFRNS